MRLLSSLAGLLAGRPREPAETVTDLELAIVKLDPPDGSTLQAGDTIAATLAWRYTAPASRLGLWLKLDLPDIAPDYTYEPDCDERGPGEGQLVRRVSLRKPGHVDALILVAKDARSREVRRVRVPVNYRFVPDAANEALRRDGQGSRIAAIVVDPRSPARLRPGTRVHVRVGVEARSEHGLQVSATPVTDAAMTFSGSVPVPDGQHFLDQSFIVGTAGHVRQLRVLLTNAGGALVDERLFDVDLRYED